MLRPEIPPAACETYWVDSYAFAAAASFQMLFFRVSGIKNRLSTKHTAGTAIG